METPKQNSAPGTTSTQMERHPVQCQRCKRLFEHLVIEEIGNLAQLRCDGLLIQRVEAVCIHCGWCFYWNIREKDLIKMAAAYEELLRRYSPE